MTRLRTELLDPIRSECYSSAVTNLLDATLAILMVAVGHFVIVLAIRRRALPSEASFLVRVYAWTAILRSCLAVALNAAAADRAMAAAFWGDSMTYDFGGHQLMLKWSGELVSVAQLSTNLSGYGWTYFVGAFYFLFGRNQLLIQLLNGLIGACTVLVVYAIAARLFGYPAARWAALFMALFPQMVFWSAGMYKDPAILLCISLSMYAVICLRDRFSMGMMILFVASTLALVALRFYVAYFVAFATLGTFVFAKRRGVLNMLVTYGLLLAAFFGALTVVVERRTLERQTSYMTLERLQVTREDQARWGRSGFGTQYDVSTPLGALAALPVGLTYLLFAPFPWAVSGIRQALAVPETLVWYALMPAFIRGFSVAVRRQLRLVLPIVVFMVSLTAAYALMQGNVGTAYRQRTQISMFFFIFMGVGLVERRRLRMNRQADGPLEDGPGSHGWHNPPGRLDGPG